MLSVMTKAIPRYCERSWRGDRRAWPGGSESIPGLSTGHMRPKGNQAQVTEQNGCAEKFIVKHHGSDPRSAYGQKAPMFLGHFPVHPVSALSRRKDNLSSQASSYHWFWLQVNGCCCMFTFPGSPQKSYCLSTPSPVIPAHPQHCH